MPIVVGRLAAQTPSFFSVLSSMLDATTSGGAHYHSIVKSACHLRDFSFINNNVQNVFTSIFIANTAVIYCTFVNEVH